MRTLDELYKSVLLKLKKANVEADGKIFSGVRRTDGKANILAYIPRDLETTLPFPFPWPTRYVLFFNSDNPKAPLRICYTNKPYDKSQDNNLFLTAVYADTEESLNKLLHHVIEHLVMGIDPVNTKGMMPQ